jgi:NADH:ubiquinone oxidoreductase subunit F (NADH-binding)/NADH:ubiquinone oxidoreductase subunit E/Pyruvate/2-oxoacid:ferredoxin oxidoreductase delta subunit
MEILRGDIETIIGEKDTAIPILQAIQDRYKYLPEEALRTASELSGISLAGLIGVASFYSQFRFTPVGDHIVKVCVGTACHVKGAERVYDSMRRHFKLKDHQHTDASGKYTVEKISCLGCCTLAPVVQIDRVTYGHVDPALVKDVISDFELQAGKKSTRAFKKGRIRETEGEIRIGLGSCCVASGSEDVRQALKSSIDEYDLNVHLKHVGCVGMCHQVPLVEIVKDSKDPVLYSKVDPGSVKGIIESHFHPPTLGKRIRRGFLNAIDRVQSDSDWEGVHRYSLNVRDDHVSAFLDRQVPIATEDRGILQPLDIEEFKSRGGFRAQKKVLENLTPLEVIEEVRNSGIRGRGGAGFTTAVKWETVASMAEKERYIICNGDEGDPGAFMDRMLLESYPYRIIEGMVIAAYAVGAFEGLLYIRAEYPLAVHRVKTALEKCYEEGFLGKNIMGSGFSLDIHVNEGAGAFVCGEETALINSVEGRRGFPRIRPPFPAEKGIHGKPTLVNNVETFAQISYIFRKGSEAIQKIGVGDSRGSKVFALAGKVKRGGLIEVPMGITIKEIVFDIGGGVAGDRAFKGVQIGGPSGGCVPASLADTPVDYHSLLEVGAMMGSGGMVVLDETDCMVDIARYFLAFTQNESCGKCTFCRVGTKRMLEILERLCTGKAKSDDLEELENLAGWTAKGSLCGLGRTAPNPVLSTLKYFREEYQAHLEGVCPTGKCKDLVTYSVNDNCIGCTICAQKCPVDAIPFTPHEKHSIDPEVCIRCDNCFQVCPSEAITVK